jgi:adenosine deaminase
MCILRDLSPEEAMETYVSALPFKDMIVGIGLDSNEYDRPPALFEDVYLRARADGFKLTCHCDVTQKNTHEHIRQWVNPIIQERWAPSTNSDWHELIGLLVERGIGVTLCPWAYVRHHFEQDLFGHIRTLFDAGVKITISSDSPAYVESNWVTDNLQLLRLKCSFTDDEISQVERNAVEVCWASKEIKDEILQEIAVFCSSSKR